MSEPIPPPPYKPHPGAVDTHPPPTVYPGAYPGAFPDPYQQPVVQQPLQHHNTTVVIAGNLGQPQVVQQPLRAWSTGVCGCFEDPFSCLCVMCFPDCYGCHLANKSGETCCLPCCVPAWLIALRAHTRGKHNIQGSICDDCCMVVCCYQCTMCQLSREIDNINRGMVPR